MACLGAVLYDPAVAATQATTALRAMTAIDTTNARITFTAPANGTVLVKLRIAQKGATTIPATLLGVLDGATVRGRQSPIVPFRVQATNLRSFSSSYTFDAATGVEIVLASTQFGWGGPNDTTTNNAYGALSFEVWETTNLLAGVHYDPATAVSKSCTALLAMTALDTTNLRLNVTVPASGRVFVRLRGTLHGSATMASIHLGVLEGSTVRMRQAGLTNSQPPTQLATDQMAVEASAVISGLTPGAVNWDAAYGVEIVGAAGQALKYGGPNDTTTDNAFGGFTFEVWSA
jgi:hypothetical protein